MKRTNIEDGIRLIREHCDLRVKEKEAEIKRLQNILAIKFGIDAKVLPKYHSWEKENQKLKQNWDKLEKEIKKIDWAKVFDGLAYSIDSDNSVWGHDTECYTDYKEMSKDFAERIIKKLISTESVRCDNIKTQRGDGE